MIIPSQYSKTFVGELDDKVARLDSIEGEKCIVIEEISNIRSTGTVKINGQVWSARSSEDDVVIPKGTVVIAENISGVKLVCKNIL